MEIVDGCALLSNTNECLRFNPRRFNKTFFLKESEIKKRWLLVDVSGLPSGRAAAEIVKLLYGKYKPEYTPHMDCGDNVIVINASKVKLTGRLKAIQRIYYRHTGYAGGLKNRTAKDMLNDPKRSHRIMEFAIKRMLGKGPLAYKRWNNLRVYSGSDHKHDAQKPITFDLGSLFRKKYEVV
jgi:large subunit ribosomal protein L13